MAVSTVICPPEHLPKFWKDASALLSPAIKRSEGRSTAASLLDSALNSRTQIWLMFDRETKDIVASGATEVNQYSDKKVLHVMLVGGSRMKEWLPGYISRLKRFAKDNHCDSIELVGRKGWLRELVKFDFVDKKSVVLELAV